MDSFRKITVFSVAAVLIMCLLISVSTVNASNANEVADTLFINGKIVSPHQSVAIQQAVAVKDGKILFTGSDKDALKFKSGNTRVYDLNGRTMIPGLHDAHLHFESGADLLTSQLSVRYFNLEQIQEKIREVVAASPKGAVIRAYHYNHAYFKDKKWPTCHDLDRVASQNPVIIHRVDGHSIWLNSLALKMAGISKDTKDVPGGEIQRFENGTPTGILKENAESLAEKINGPQMVIPGRSKKSPLLTAMTHANKLGITCVTTSGTLKLVEQLNKMEKEGKLTLRFNVWLPAEDLEQYKAKGAAYCKGTDMVKMSFLKIFADGSIGSASAALFKPYKDRPQSTGILIHPIEELNRLVAEAHQNNWPVGVHAIGDRGVHLVLNAIENAQKKYGKKEHVRHRIEHSQFVTDSDLERYKKLGVIPSMQPTHCTTDLLVVEDRIGHDRAALGYRWNSFKKEGLMIAFGTDWPVEPLDPRRGLYSAVERKNIESGQPENGWFPGEQITLMDAIKYYTLGAAYAAGDENKMGTIENGKVADLVVFDGDLFEAAKKDKKNILTMPVYMTMVAGKIVYKR